MTVYDYSDARPDPSQLDSGAMRYLCDGPQGGKQLQPPELQKLWVVGKAVGLVWENDQTDPDGGYNQGVAYGSRARQQARALGFPDSVPIYAAVDKRLTAQTRTTAVDYLRGFRDGAGLMRPYGEGALIDACVEAGLADCGWMPETWGPSTNVALVQLVENFQGVTQIPGTDANRVLRPDWGGWHPNMTPQEDYLTMPLAPIVEMSFVQGTINEWFAECLGRVPTPDDMYYWVRGDGKDFKGLLPVVQSNGDVWGFKEQVFLPVARQDPGYRGSKP